MGRAPASKAQPLQGDLSPAAALAQLLSSTGLTYRFAGENLVVISAATEQGSHVTSPVRVQGSEGEASGGAGNVAGVVGANGSRDVTATEGTHSLTTGETSIASKAPQALKDTAQSLSVVTRQRIEDQQLDSLADVLDQVTGITVVQGEGISFTPGTNLNPSFYSRGFQVQNFQIDGGAPLTQGNSNYQSEFVPVFDMSIYDHVEVLRGASGLYGGVGDPGGIISLERKRPLDHEQLIVDAQLGSFDHQRISIDDSTPLLDEDRLAVRAVLTHDDSDFFYNAATKKIDLAYLNLEAKPAARTVVNLGASYTNQRGTPWQYGLPRYSDGSDIQLPREVCLCVSWSEQVDRQAEFFAQLHQGFGEHWSLQVNLGKNNQTGYYDDAAAQAGYTGIDRQTGAGLSVYGARGDLMARQATADLFLNGEFEALGHLHQVTLGANYQDSNGSAPGGAASNFSYEFQNQPDIFAWDPSAWPRSAAQISPNTSLTPFWLLKQWGIYGTVRLNPLESDSTSRWASDSIPTARNR